jgi:hypothetical protein
VSRAPSDADQLFDELGDTRGLLLEERDAVTGGLVGSASARLHKRRAGPRGTVKTRRSRRPLVLAGAALVLVVGGAAAYAVAGGGGGSSSGAAPATGSATAAAAKAAATDREQPAAAAADVSSQIAAITLPAPPVRIAYQVPAGIRMPSITFSDGTPSDPYPMNFAGSAAQLVCPPAGGCTLTFDGQQVPLAGGAAQLQERLQWIDAPKNPCPPPPLRRVTVTATGSTTVGGVTVPTALAFDVHEAVSHTQGRTCIEVRPDRLHFTAAQLT